MSPKIFPITNTIPSHIQLKSISQIQSRSTLNKVDMPPQHDTVWLYSPKNNLQIGIEIIISCQEFRRIK